MRYRKSASCTRSVYMELRNFELIAQESILCTRRMMNMVERFPDGVVEASSNDPRLGRVPTFFNTILRRSNFTGPTDPVAAHAGIGAILQKL